MTWLQNYVKNDEENKRIHVIGITKSPPTKIMQSTNFYTLVQFEVFGCGKYDIFQVYKTGDEYYRISGGLELLNISRHTPINHRCIPFSLALDEGEAEADFYFCVIPSSLRETVLKQRTCPRAYCEENRFTIMRTKRILLTDQTEFRKVYLRKGDKIELEWSSEQGAVYHIEEKKYCPKSGGVYTYKKSFEEHNTVYYIEGKKYCTKCGSLCCDEKIYDNELSATKYTKEFDEMGMSFLFRFTDKNQIHDITACVVNRNHAIRHIRINDDNIPRDIITIEQNDWVLFEWDFKSKPNVAKVESFYDHESKKYSIEVCILSEKIEIIFL